jgi:hypothetical protein
LHDSSYYFPPPSMLRSLKVVSSLERFVQSKLLISFSCGPYLTKNINPLNAELNPTCHLLELLGAHHVLHVSRIRVKDAVYKTNVKRRSSLILKFNSILREHGIIFLLRHGVSPSGRAV